MNLFEAIFYLLLYIYAIFGFFFLTRTILYGIQTSLTLSRNIIQIGIKDELFTNFDIIFNDLSLDKLD